MIFIKNPNEDKSIKSTEKLNSISRDFRKTKFYKVVENEGFELNHVNFTWEWIINFKDGSFMALNEKGNDIYIYAYKYKEDLNPNIYELKNFKTKHMSKMIQTIKTIYYIIKK